MSLMSVETARDLMLSSVRPGAIERLDLAQADGRWLARPITADRDQPPFDASAMDGWAVRDADAVPGRSLDVVGESAAGHGGDRPVAAGQAMRIFTGAPLPTGVDRVVIQEQAARLGDRVTLGTTLGAGRNVRSRGCDFRRGDVLIDTGVRLTPWRLSLIAAAGVAAVDCGRSPRLALLSTGDELVTPGRPAGPHQIFESTTPALAALARRHGVAEVRLIRARDDDGAIRQAVAGAPFDLLVTVGGASVGDHDRVKPALRADGAAILFEGIAMRPGKPTWFGHLGDGRPVLGLPGNPASALVCAELFLLPLLAALQGGRWILPRAQAVLDAPLPPNGPREHYLRAERRTDDAGRVCVRPFADQDSSLVSVMARADVLIRRAPNAPAAGVGDWVETLQPS